jgi:hypothetical protein
MKLPYQSAFTRYLPLAILIVVIALSCRAFGENYEHKFWDARNKSFFVANAAAQTFDMVTTRRSLDNQTKCVPSGIRDGLPYTYCYYPGGIHYREINPISRPFEYQGWPGSIAYHYGISLAGNALLSYWAHKAGHHNMERWLQVTPAASSVYWGSYNLIHSR